MRCKEVPISLRHEKKPCAVTEQDRVQNMKAKIYLIYHMYFMAYDAVGSGNRKKVEIRDTRIVWAVSKGNKVLKGFRGVITKEVERIVDEKRLLADARHEMYSCKRKKVLRRKKGLFIDEFGALATSPLASTIHSENNTASSRPDESHSPTVVIVLCY